MSQQHPESSTPVPADPEANPEQTVDALEEKVAGRRQEQRRDDTESDAEFEQDVDPGKAARGENPNRAAEPPS